jgi:pimeloyl-ACP methyl ester carboxylesterase
MLTRRELLQSAIALAAMNARAQSATKFIDTPTLTIGYEESGNPTGFPVILLHGFPDDVRTYDAVIPPLVKAGLRVFVPYLRGYGPTRFRDAKAPRMAEQAAIGQDLIDFADALKLPRIAAAGYDWGGRAAGVAAALHPDRFRAIVLIGGYTIQNVFNATQPAPPEAEERIWYQWYFNTERGRNGLTANRKALCKLLWKDWSPTWKFTDETYDRTAPSFDNPDFVDLVIHSYRHRLGNAPGDPQFDVVEHQLAQRPKITVPTITLYGADDSLGRPAPETPPREKADFPTLIARRVIQGSGHFMPREKPDAVSAAILEVLR